MRVALLVALLLVPGLLAATPVAAEPDPADMAHRRADDPTITELGGDAPATASPVPAAPPVATPAAPSPSRVEERYFFSATLGRAMHYYAYLPPGYDDDPTARYPVVYLLHGMGGNADEWLGYGVATAADTLMGAGAIRPYILILPHGEQGYWIDQADGGPQWATCVVADVVPAIDARYRTLADRQDRALGGFSMGGHGALQIAMNHPTVFGIVGAHSPSFRERQDLPAYFGDDAALATRDPLQLIAAHPAIARTLTLWLDFGLLDGFRAGQLALEAELVQLGIPHQFHEWPGDHSGVYWGAHMGDYLRFYAAAFAPAGEAGR